MADAWSARGAAAPDLYAVLGVDRGAEPEVIDAAYRALARKYHPDVNRAADAAERTRQLNDAYRTLHDPAARAAYDTALSLRPAGAPARTRSTPPPAGDRPVDLFRAALADVWRGAKRARQAAREEAAREAAVRQTPAQRAPARRGTVRRLTIPALALGLGAAAGAGAATQLVGRSSRALRAYWSAAALGRAAVVEARQPHEALTAAGYPAALGNTSFVSVAAQLAAALEGATARLRSVGSVPPQAETYHFLQLDDWREERELRAAQRDAIQNRSPEAWSIAADRETAWRTSPLHTKTEIAAAQVAALAARW